MWRASHAPSERFGVSDRNLTTIGRDPQMAAAVEVSVHAVTRSETVLGGKKEGGVVFGAG